MADKRQEFTVKGEASIELWTGAEAWVDAGPTAVRVINHNDRVTIHVYPHGYEDYAAYINYMILDSEISAYAAKCRKGRKVSVARRKLEDAIEQFHDMHYTESQSYLLDYLSARMDEVVDEYTSMLRQEGQQS